MSQQCLPTLPAPVPFKPTRCHFCSFLYVTHVSYSSQVVNFNMARRAPQSSFYPFLHLLLLWRDKKEEKVSGVVWSPRYVVLGRLFDPSLSLVFWEMEAILVTYLERKFWRFNKLPSLKCLKHSIDLKSRRVHHFCFKEITGLQSILFWSNTKICHRFTPI